MQKVERLLFSDYKKDITDAEVARGLMEPVLIYGREDSRVLSSREMNIC